MEIGAEKANVPLAIAKARLLSWLKSELPARATLRKITESPLPNKEQF
jgi:hypothetical protein